MKYLLLCCFNEAAWASIPRPQRDEIMQDYSQVLRSIEKNGQHLASAQLQPSATATTVREKNGKRVITDGPFAETKEQLGGYHLVECRDLDEAMSIAQRIPTLPFGGAVEVRALMPGEA